MTIAETTWGFHGFFKIYFGRCLTELWPKGYNRWQWPSLKQAVPKVEISVSKCLFLWSLPLHLKVGGDLQQRFSIFLDFLGRQKLLGKSSCRCTSPTFLRFYRRSPEFWNVPRNMQAISGTPVAVLLHGHNTTAPFVCLFRHWILQQITFPDGL